MTTRRDLYLGGVSLAILAAGGAWATAHDMGSMEAYSASVARARATLPQTPDLAELIRYATLAPSGHNTQPWTFRASADQIQILPDSRRRTPVVDPDNHHLFVGLGCAAENLALAAKARGLGDAMAFNATGDGSITLKLDRGPVTPSVLFEAIPQRRSARGVYDGSAVSTADLRSLADAAADPGVDLALITDRAGIGRIRDLIISGNTLQMSDPAFMRELRSWIRFSPRQAMETGDGLFTATTGNPTLPAWLGPTFFDRAISAGAENDRYARQVTSSSGLAVFLAKTADPEHWTRVGRAAQRFALQATVLGLRHAFINQPVEVASLRPELAHLVGLPGRRPDLLLRFGYGAALPFSARRPVEAVLA